MEPDTNMIDGLPCAFVSGRCEDCGAEYEIATDETHVCGPQSNDEEPAPAQTEGPTLGELFAAARLVIADIADVVADVQPGAAQPTGRKAKGQSDATNGAGGVLVV